MRATTVENRPAGFLAVPLNIRCSRKCASPDFPAVSSAAPTLYQIICVMTGARWSGMTTSCSPFASLKSATLAPAGSAAKPAVTNQGDTSAETSAKTTAHVSTAAAARETLCLKFT
jgi:hypothetical protein